MSGERVASGHTPNGAGPAYAGLGAPDGGRHGSDNLVVVDDELRAWAETVTGAADLSFEPVLDGMLLKRFRTVFAESGGDDAAVDVEIEYCPGWVRVKRSGGTIMTEWDGSRDGLAEAVTDAATVLADEGHDDPNRYRLS